MTFIPSFKVVLAAGMMLSAGISTVVAEEAVELITPQEAELPPAESDGVVRNITRGPAVDVVAPAAIGVAGNFRFAVKFKPRNGVEINPDEVRITYMRNPQVDLTARLKEFITTQGIDAPVVVAPPGEHVIEIEATDKEGRLGRGQMTLTVAPAE